MHLGNEKGNFRLGAKSGAPPEIVNPSKINIPYPVYGNCSASAPLRPFQAFAYRRILVLNRLTRSSELGNNERTLYHPITGSNPLGSSKSLF